MKDLKAKNLKKGQLYFINRYYIDYKKGRYYLTDLNCTLSFKTLKRLKEFIKDLAN
jgi:CRISPR/Cas system CSM-associated protein Csm4 (group 5 of RAMP superfamily)